MTTKSKWFKIFSDLWYNGILYAPRGLKTFEIEDYVFELNPIEDKLCAFKAREIDLPYLVGELFWYLSADRDNTSIEDFSSFWKTIKNQNKPYYNSNYGYYFFKEQQVNYVIKTLIEDKDSRQACIIINRPEVMMSTSKDKLCTNVITFRIRNNKLNMSVNMRSNDIIFGTTIDVFLFSIIYEIILVCLKQHYPNLEVGRYVHKADSFHIYERHFNMLDSICINQEWNDFLDSEVPRISSYKEVEFLIKHSLDIIKEIKTGEFLLLHDSDFLFVDWCRKQLNEKYGKK